MKKKMFFISLLFVMFIAGLFVLTGCGKTVTSDGMTIEKRDFGEITNAKQKVSDTESVVCSMTQDEANVTMNQNITLSFKSNTLKSADISIDAVLDDELLDYIDTFVSSLDTQFENFEYGDNISIKKTSTGARVTYTMDEDDFEGQYGSASTKSAIISELEKVGYSCN